MEDDGPEPTLQNVIDQTTLKWIFVGGKGGVGKTTCSSSLAVQLAARRESVLIISTDPAHNLSDAFRQKFTKTPSLVTGFTNLYAMVRRVERGGPHVAAAGRGVCLRSSPFRLGTSPQHSRLSPSLSPLIDHQHPIQTNPQEVDPTPDSADFEAMEWAQDSFFQELASSIPGIDEAMSFAEVMKQVQSMDYSTIVFDTAPTGHTLRLLNFPNLLEKGLNKLVGLKAAMGGMVGQVTRMVGLPGGDELPDMLLGKVEGLLGVVRQVNAQFQDPALTTFVCVCIPEFLSLYETERLVQELARYGIDSRNIVINQVIFPEAAAGSRLLEARVRMQAKYLEQFRDLYEDFHLVRLPLLEEEVRGSDALRAFGVNLLKPYVPPATGDGAAAAAAGGSGREAAFEAEVKALRARVAELEAQLAGGKAR
jgi:arsenite-transporting ATPase